MNLQLLMLVASVRQRQKDDVAARVGVGAHQYVIVWIARVASRARIEPRIHGRRIGPDFLPVLKRGGYDLRQSRNVRR